MARRESLYTLRERLGLYGSKNACEQGECGSGSIMLDETLVCACLVLTGSAIGRDIKTIESLAPEGSLSVIQQAFVDAGAIQCGFCTPGLLVTIEDFLDDNAEPTELEIREAISETSADVPAMEESLKLFASHRKHPLIWKGQLMTATETYKVGARSGVGVSSQRPDAVPKATGEFSFSSDLSSHNMLWGKTLRPPPICTHPQH